MTDRPVVAPDDLWYVSRVGGYGGRGGATVVDGVRISIPADKIEQLFQKFSRLETHKRQGKKGTGLGLYICREIMEKHGGRIWAESEPGKWTRFCLTLPRAAG